MSIGCARFARCGGTIYSRTMYNEHLFPCGVLCFIQGRVEIPSLVPAAWASCGLGIIEPEMD